MTDDIEDEVETSEVDVEEEFHDLSNVKKQVEKNHIGATCLNDECGSTNTKWIESLVDLRGFYEIKDKNYRGVRMEKHKCNRCGSLFQVNHGIIPAPV